MSHQPPWQPQQPPYGQPQWEQQPPAPQYTQYPQQMPNQYPGWDRNQWQSPMYQPPPLMQPPVQPLPMKRSRTPLLLGCGALIVILLACGIVAAMSMAASSSNTGKVVASSSTNAASLPTSAHAPQQHFTVGQTVKVGDVWQIQILSAKISSGSMFKPQHPEDVYLIFSIALKNISPQEQAVSSLVQFHLQDSTGQQYNETIDPDAGATLDGKVEAGSPLRGTIVYEVPKARQLFILGFEASLVETGQTMWDIHV